MKHTVLGLLSAALLLTACDGGNESFQDDLEETPEATQPDQSQELGGQQEPDNILQERTAVYSMADEVFDRLGQVADQEELRQSDAIAVFAPERPPGADERQADGIGVGLHRESGEVVYYDLRFAESSGSSGSGDERYVLLFHDEDLYATFRAGEINGQELQQISREEGRVVASILTADDMLEELDLSRLEFQRNDRLTDATIADPEPLDFPG